MIANVCAEYKYPISINTDDNFFPYIIIINLKFVGSSFTVKCFYWKTSCDNLNYFSNFLTVQNFWLSTSLTPQLKTNKRISVKICSIDFPHPNLHHFGHTFLWKSLLTKLEQYLDCQLDKVVRNVKADGGEAF